MVSHLSEVFPVTHTSCVTQAKFCAVTQRGAGGPLSQLPAWALLRSRWCVSCGTPHGLGTIWLLRKIQIVGETEWRRGKFSVRLSITLFNRMRVVSGLVGCQSKGRQGLLEQLAPHAGRQGELLQLCLRREASRELEVGLLHSGFSAFKQQYLTNRRDQVNLSLSDSPESHQIKMWTLKLIRINFTDTVS